MSSADALRPLIIRLWFQLTALTVVSLVFYEALYLAHGKAQGRSFCLTTQGWRTKFWCGWLPPPSPVY
jgi:hypothetical protein